MKIYVDFDDVLCETARRLALLASEMFGRRVPYGEISCFNLQRAFSLDDRQIEALMDRAHEVDFLSTLAPCPGGVETLRDLLAAGHLPTIVTGRPAFSYGGSLKWLARYGLEKLPLVHVDKYGRAGMAPRKEGQPATLSIREMDQIPFDLLIDDSPLALDLLRRRQEARVLVYNRPWNQTYKIAANMRRVDSWSEVRMICGLA